MSAESRAPAANRSTGLSFYARGFHQSADGAIWIAGHGGLFRYDAGRLTHWGTVEGLSSNFVTSLAAEPDGTLWLSTADAGLNRFKDGRITQYGLAQGLNDETIFRVLPDGRGGVWMTSNRGLFRVARAELDAIAEGRGRERASAGATPRPMGCARRNSSAARSPRAW